MGFVDDAVLKALFVDDAVLKDLAEKKKEAEVPVVAEVATTEEVKPVTTDDKPNDCPSGCNCGAD